MEILNRIKEYRVELDGICKDILVYGADVEKMQENVDKLDFLAKRIGLYYKVVELSDIDAKQSMLNRVDHVRLDISWLLDRIYRYIETDSFTDYYSVVKGCVEIIG